jgi:hypothetical protein
MSRSGLGVRRGEESGARRRLRNALSGLLAVLAVAAGLVLATAPAGASATVNLYVVPSGGVTSGNYPSVCTQAVPCTLGWALDQTNSTTNVNDNNAIINLAAGTYPDSAYTIEATGGAPNSVELLGEGGNPSATVLDGGGVGRPIYVDGVDYQVTIENLTLQNGNSGSGYGGNLLADTTGLGSVHLYEANASGGYSMPGGQVDVTGGPLYVDFSTVENSINGTWGSTATAGQLDIADSTYAGNANSAVVLRSSSTATIGINDSTLTANHNYGVVDDSTGSMSVKLSTITGNSSGGIDTVSGPTENITSGGDILASNDGHDCELGGSDVTNGGYDVMDDSSCLFGNADGSKVVSTSAIGLMPLASNGGDTQTERITATSAAYDVVPNGAMSPCTIYTNDERTLPEIEGSATACDAGAYQVAPPTLTAISASSAVPGATVTLTGTNLFYFTSLTFGAGNVPANIDSRTATALIVTVPTLAIGSQPITVTNADGSATIAFSVPPPQIAISGFSAKVKKSRGVAELVCSVQACAGTVTLTETLRKRIKKGKHTSIKVKTVVLGSTNYSQNAGASFSATLKLSKAGDKAYKRAHKHPLTLTVTLTGGTSATLTVR